VYVPLPFDLAGTARASATGGSAGVFEMNPPAAGGGLTGFMLLLNAGG
jgi:hypothetical protein